MNIIEEGFQTKEEKKNKNTIKIVIVAIVLLLFIIIGIIGYILYIQSTQLKLTVDGASNEELKNLLVFDGDEIYIPIKEVSSILGYNGYDGEYNGTEEKSSKCYIENEYEVANFSLGSNKIYKLDISDDSNDNYEYVYSKKPVKAINGVLYATSDGIEKAFNISFSYDKENNQITIYTLPYLVSTYENKIKDYGYEELEETFANHKTVLQNMLVVTTTNNKMGIIDVEGNTVIDAKYEEIKYLPITGDFLVTSNKKKGIVGLVSNKVKTRVEIAYDNIELMDSDKGLYLVEDNDKYGVIDIKGNKKIYIEYDEIGIDISNYQKNELKNKYIIADNVIPVKKNDNWALFDTNGNQLTEFKYDNFGYEKRNDKDAINLLVIPDYNVIVACKDKKYTLLNSAGKELFGIIADDIYMTINEGKKSYFIIAGDNKYDAIDQLDKMGVTTTKQTKNSTTKTENNNNNNSNNNNNNNNSNNNSNNSDNAQDNGN